MTDEKPIIKATTPNSKKYDTKIDIYTDDPREKHESIHIAIDSDDKSAHIIDTTNGDTEHTDIKCYLTTHVWDTSKKISMIIATNYKC